MRYYLRSSKGSFCSPHSRTHNNLTSRTLQNVDVYGICYSVSLIALSRLSDLSLERKEKQYQQMECSCPADERSLPHLASIIYFRSPPQDSSSFVLSILYGRARASQDDYRGWWHDPEQGPHTKVLINTTSSIQSDRSSNDSSSSYGPQWE